jgi:hypothetical protein
VQVGKNLHCRDCVLYPSSVAAVAAPCQKYPEAAARAIKPRVEALRLVEREGGDRRSGLDTRPRPYLVGQARAVANTIGEPPALLDEDGLDRCPDAVPHVRRVRTTAALALAGALEEQTAGAATQIFETDLWAGHRDLRGLHAIGALARRHETIGLSAN